MMSMLLSASDGKAKEGNPTLKETLMTTECRKIYTHTFETDKSYQKPVQQMHFIR